MAWKNPWGWACHRVGRGWAFVAILKALQKACSGGALVVESQAGRNLKISLLVSLPSFLWMRKSEMGGAFPAVTADKGLGAGWDPSRVTRLVSLPPFFLECAPFQAQGSLAPWPSNQSQLSTGMQTHLQTSRDSFSHISCNSPGIPGLQTQQNSYTSDSQLPTSGRLLVPQPRMPVCLLKSPPQPSLQSPPSTLEGMASSSGSLQIFEPLK